MTVYLADTFDTIATGSTTPSGWTEETTVGGAQGVQYWTGAAAPAYMLGKVAAATQNAVDKYLSRQFGSSAGSGAKVRLRVATTNNTSTRAGHYLFYSGTTVAFSILLHTDGNIYITNMAGSAANVKSTYATGTLYDIIVTLGSSGAISNVSVNGSNTASPGTMNNSLTTINTVRADAYNGGSGAGTLYFDAFIADDSSAVPNGSLTTTGTQDGVSLGGINNANITVAYTNSSSVASAILRVERSPDNSTWTDKTTAVTLTSGASGWTIKDASPLSGNNYYRITAANGTGDQSALTTGALVYPTSRTYTSDGVIAPLAGTAYASGSHGGVSCGCDKYSVVTLAYVGPDATATSLKVERSADGSSWSDVSSAGYIATTDLGSGNWKIVDSRPQYGSGATTYGGTAYYRVSPKAGGVTGAATSAVSLTANVDATAVNTARASMMHTLISSQSGGYYPTTFTAIGGDKYPHQWTVAMSYAYLLTGTSSYKTDATNEFNYFTSSNVDSNKVIIAPDETTYVYRDYMTRNIYFAALSARIMRMAGEAALAASWTTEIDKWAKAWFDKVNSGNPAPSSQTHYGWDPNNLRSGTQNAVWTANTAYTVGKIVKPTSSNSRTYRCTSAGTSHATTQPTWPTTAGAVVGDGTVVWECIGATGYVTYSIYTNNGTTYPGVAGTDLMDLNQEMEEAACWALLTTDPNSAFYSAGTYKTKAEARITDITALIQTYQVSRGAIPIGEALSSGDSANQQYDTVYGAFTMSTAAITLRLRPDLCHARLSTWLSRALDWMETDYGTEPLSTNQYAGGTSIGHPEIEFRDAAYKLLGRSNPTEPVWNTAAFNSTTTDKWGYYGVNGTPASYPNDAWQARSFLGIAVATAILTSRSYTSDGYVISQPTRTYTSDGTVVARTSSDYTSDGVIVSGTAGTRTTTYTSDGVIKATMTRSYTADGYVATASPTPPDPPADPNLAYRMFFDLSPFL